MRVSVFLTFIFLLFLSAPNVYAVSVSIDTYPTQVKSSEFEVSVSVVGAKPATNYLKITLSAENSHTNLIETWNGNEWYGGSDGKQYSAIVISEKTTTATLKGRLKADVLSGQYQLSVKRYTASGTAADDSVNTVMVSVETTPAKTLSPSPTASATPNPHTPAPTVTPSLQPMLVMTSKPLAVSEPKVLTASVAAITEPTFEVSTPSTSPVETNQTATPSNTPRYALFVGGVISLLIGLLTLGIGVSGIIKVFTHEGSHRFL